MSSSYSFREKLRAAALTALTAVVWMVLVTVLLAGTAVIGWAWWAVS